METSQIIGFTIADTDFPIWADDKLTVKLDTVYNGDVFAVIEQLPLCLKVAYPNSDGIHVADGYLKRADFLGEKVKPGAIKSYQTIDVFHLWPWIIPNPNIVSYAVMRYAYNVRGDHPDEAGNLSPVILGSLDRGDLVEITAGWAGVRRATRINFLKNGVYIKGWITDTFTTSGWQFLPGTPQPVYVDHLSSYPGPRVELEDYIPPAPEPEPQPVPTLAALVAEYIAKVDKLMAAHPEL